MRALPHDLFICAIEPCLCRCPLSVSRSLSLSLEDDELFVDAVTQRHSYRASPLTASRMSTTCAANRSTSLRSSSVLCRTRSPAPPAPAAPPRPPPLPPLAPPLAAPRPPLAPPFELMLMRSSRIASALCTAVANRLPPSGRYTPGAGSAGRPRRTRSEAVRWWCGRERRRESGVRIEGWARRARMAGEVAVRGRGASEWGLGVQGEEGKGRTDGLELRVSHGLDLVALERVVPQGRVGLGGPVQVLEALAGSVVVLLRLARCAVLESALLESATQLERRRTRDSPTGTTGRAGGW